MTWKDITLKQFYEIKEICEIDNKYRVLNLIDTIYGIDSANLPINELGKYPIDFLNKEVPNVKLQKIYTLNGRKYDSSCDLTTITVAQYIDFTSYTQKDNPKYEEILSVFFIPKGHQYNDGYDMQQVQDDLLALDICTIQTAAFFFRNQLLVFLEAFLAYFKKSLKKMNLKKEQLKEIENLLKKADWPSLALYLTSQSSVKRQMRK